MLNLFPLFQLVIIILIGLVKPIRLVFFLKTKIMHSITTTDYVIVFTSAKNNLSYLDTDVINL